MKDTFTENPNSTTSEKQTISEEPAHPDSKEPAQNSQIQELPEEGSELTEEEFQGILEILDPKTEEAAHTKDNASLEAMNEKARQTVLLYTAAASATCALPIPFADAPMLIGEQTSMLVALCEIYHIDLQKKALQSLLWGILGVTGTTVLGKSIFSGLMKLIPGAGTLAGGALSAATAGSLTAALGAAWCELCRQVLSGTRKVEDLTGPEGIKLLTTTLQNQLRLEMKEKPQEEDILKSARIPDDEQIIVLEAASAASVDDIKKAPSSAKKEETENE